MKITAAFVMSLNGKTTQGNNPDIYSWASVEDSEHFFSLIQDHPVIIMGSNTYEAARKTIKLKSGKLRAVMTKKIEKYSSEEVSGQLEFFSDSPKELMQKLERRGYARALFVGGSTLFQAFLKEKLIQIIYVTVEPYLFGTGAPLMEGEKLDVSLKLKNIKRLNFNGTLLLQYTTL